MTDRGSSAGSDLGPAAPVTGVATGGLGTGANLEDTQVFRTEDLGPAQAADADPPAGPAEHDLAAQHADPAEPAVPPPAVPPMAALPVEPVQREPVPLAPAPSGPVQATVSPRRASIGQQRGRGIAGLLAAALVVLTGVAFMVSRDDNTLGAGQTAPSAEAPATANPDGNNTGGGGGGDDPGKGKDKDNDKGCHGNGRGNGCGGGD